ncbi:MAG: hypothetical protein HQM16_11925 [Deltaproteobacteria bacterium]|nr:hypothetical protein [Deltaproteobacteria bacterium]
MKIFLFMVCLFFFLGAPAHALEADQYYIWKSRDLKDSTERINSLFNDELQHFLAKRVNNKKIRAQIPCSKIPYRFFRYVRPHFFLDRLKRSMLKDEGVYHFPTKKSLFKDYSASIFRGPIWPFVMPVSQTVRINNVFLGTDKIDHFFSSGRKYYGAYLRAVGRGEDQRTAQKRAIDYGIMWIQETGILGYWSSNAFSYADMESNYQGMMLCIDFCEGADPIIKYNKDKGWVVNKKIDLKKYINPLWDEAYNNSYFLQGRWRGVKKVLSREYCEMAKNADVQKIWSDYTKRLTPTFHTDYLKGLMRLGKVPNPGSQSLNAVCGFPKDVMSGVPLWDGE